MWLAILSGMPLHASVASQQPLRIAIVAGCAITAAATWLVPASPAPAARLARSIPPVTVAAPAVAPPAAATAPVLPPAAAAVHSNELLFAFVAGDATYLKLAALQTPDAEDPSGIAVPRHGTLRHVHDDDGVDAAIATVALRHVPAAYAAWQGRKVKVDNTCEATVIGFAVVSRLSGDPGYAGKQAWDAAGVMAEGSRMLAAKLDRCTGTFARTATLPDIIVPTRLHDAALERAAIDALLASAPARETQREWDAQRTATGGAPAPWHTDAALLAEVLRHPGTGETFVSVHGHVLGGCGDPEANVWGLFRVTDGALVPVQLRQLGDLQHIDALIDVDGDGALEMLGKPWLRNAEILTDANGDQLDELRVPFHGCPC